MIKEKIRKNWFVILLLVVIVFLVTRSTTILPANVGNRGVGDFATGGTRAGVIDSVGGVPFYQSKAAPVEQSNRMVVKNTNLSLAVIDVRVAIDGIMNSAQKLGGFLVETSLSVPEGGATGSISVRIPSTRLDEGLSAIRALGVKVVSENVVGTDVTDQYVDLDARLETLMKTKVKFDQIMASAIQIQDILNIQRELVNLQSQIDSIRGQQKYLEQTAKLSLVTVYLATDELALPYAPAQPWRPSVIFKEAVRSLIVTFRGVGSVLIWIVVYSPIWAPLGLLVWWLKRRKI